MDELVITLAESINSDSRIVLPADGIQRELRTSVCGVPMLHRADGCVVRVAVEIRSIEVQERRGREQQTRRQRVDPGEVGQGVAFALYVARARLQGIAVVRDLVVVAAERGDEAELVGGVLVEDQRAKSA